MMTDRAGLVEQGLIVVSPIRLKRVKRVISFGGVRYSVTIQPTEHYSVIPLNNRHHRNPYPEADITYARPYQRSINKMHLQILAHASSSIGMKVFVPLGTDVDQVRREFAKAGLSVQEYDPEYGPPVFGQPPPLNSEFFKVIQDRKEDTYELLGIHPFMEGSDKGMPTTVRGTLMAEERGMRRTGQHLRNIYSGYSQTARVLIDHYKYVYRHEKMIAIVNSNGGTETTTINQLLFDDLTGAVLTFNDIKKGNYDVQVEAGSTLPISRQAKQENALQLYGMNLVDDVEALKFVDGIDVDGVLERKSMYQQLISQLQQFEEELKQTQGTAQRLENQVIQERISRIVAEAKARIQSTTNRFDKAADLFEARSSDQLQIQRERAAMQARQSSALQQQR